jgi:predicted nucleic acid-binding protein
VIVVDTNVIHYCWVNGQHTALAQAVRRHDPEWHAPLLWRSELRNVLTAYLRRRLLSRAQIAAILDTAGEALTGNEHLIDDQPILDIVSSSTLTAYDAEFVALAAVLDVPLVTADRAVLQAFPQRAQTMRAFLQAASS